MQNHVVARKGTRALPWALLWLGAAVASAHGEASGRDGGLGRAGHAAPEAGLERSDLVGQRPDAAGVGTPDGFAGRRPDLAATRDDGPGSRDLDQNIARAAAARGLVVQLDRVLKKATDFVPGDVLEVRLRSHAAGPLTYEIRVLSGDGRIRLVRIDAARNEVIEVRRP